MSLIRGNALELIQKLFDIPGSQASATTDLDTANISQVVDVLTVARRSTRDAVRAGYYQGVLENVHSGADDELSFIDPYNVGGSASAPYPASVPLGWDVWLLGVSGFRSSGAGGLTGATVSLNPGIPQQGWGQDDTGAVVAATGPRYAVAAFDTISTLTAALDVMQTEAGLVYQPINQRIERGVLFDFHSTAAAAAEFQMIFITGLFPAGLGQDLAT